MSLDPGVVFAAAVDRNGYLPVHNLKYSEPQGATRCGTTLTRATGGFSTTWPASWRDATPKPFLSQTYPRDLGGGRMELIKDISAPIYVNGKHWGGLRLGARIS